MTEGAGDDVPRAEAAIDPPLFAGLYMYTKRLTPQFGVLYGALPCGHGDVDRMFVMRMHDWERARDLLFEVSQLLVTASQSFDIVVKDRTVEVIGGSSGQLPEVTHTALQIARAISAFTNRMEPRPAEVDARARWNDLAIQLGLSFDPRRWLLYGKFEGIDVSVTIEGSPPSVSTMCRAKWRMPLACGVVMRRGFRESVGFTTWKDGTAPGFPELDKVAVLEARDLERARTVLLGDQAVRSAIAGIAAEANFTIDDREIAVGRGGFAGRTEIRQRLEELRFVVDKVTPPLTSGAGPFR